MTFCRSGIWMTISSMSHLAHAKQKQQQQQQQQQDSQGLGQGAIPAESGINHLNHRLLLSQ